MNERIRVLVPLDGSPQAEAALPLAAPLLRACPARLTLFRVVARDECSRPAEAYLDRVKGALQTQGIVAEAAVEWGAPAEEILWKARTGSFHLIAMTTHGRGGVRRLFGGSVAEEVVRGAEVPVLLNRPGQAPPAGTRFVVGLDGSPLAEAVLPDAVALARLLHAELHVLQVVLPAVVSPAGFVPAPEPNAYLRSVCDRLSKQAVKALPVVRQGLATGELLRYAKESGAGLVCMTTHGRSRMRRIILGSVAEQMLREAPCPVLIRRVLRTDLPVLDPVPAAVPPRTA